MKKPHLLLLASCFITSAWAEPFQQAEVTKVVNRVELLAPGKPARTAAPKDLVHTNQAVQTGANSRSELVFPDGTLTRIGANSLFRFENGTRTIDLERGTLLFDGERKKGGGTVRTAAVTAAVTGTSFLFEYTPGEVVKLIVLNGKARLALVSNPRVQRELRAGQMIRMRPDDTRIPRPVTVDLKRLVETSLLLEGGGFGVLPGMNRILQAIALQDNALRRGRLQPPGSVAREVTIAQTTRGAAPQPQVQQQSRPAPQPMPAMAPPQPIPTPPPAPPTPPPTPIQPPTPIPTPTTGPQDPGYGG